jgi:GNAT superfamily N-acetyltransferase
MHETVQKGEGEEEKEGREKEIAASSFLYCPIDDCRDDAMDVTYQLEPDLTADEFIDVLVRSTLAERRPVNDRPTIQQMLAHAAVIVTARVEGKLVGISRAISDFGYCTYLSDLAVDEAFQGQGIGRELVHRTHEAAGLCTMLILLAAPKAQTYYPHIGI